MIVLRDKLGLPVETFKGRPITNLIRLLLHTNIRRTLGKKSFAVKNWLGCAHCRDNGCPFVATNRSQAERHIGMRGELTDAAWKRVLDSTFTR